MKELFLHIGIPTAGTVPAAFSGALTQLAVRVATGKVVLPEPAKLRMQVHFMESANWINNRERLAKAAVRAKATHLLFLDDDMTFEPHVLDILFSRQKDIVLTNYLIKSTPARTFVAADENGQRIVTTSASTGIEKAGFSGFGVSLFNVNVFRDIPQPWFMPLFYYDRDEYTTEDVAFFGRARQAGFDVWVDHDASKLLTHIGRREWKWDEVKHG